ncbi:septation ring formation regulator EzrA [Skermanella stibiiresistens SB22]|uniref:Septation ring formation regulator EzrA n=1 Tax=Skermanella stibiiresistens SB22 TaxID=1385369 RepID=W9H7S1_9PROT|nr:septum formation initiator family protein [Skermanella stibiiresistens]EWY42280.1 septation ring formation regulator EzrA [Skermanella stibiiresistens SB22]
MTAIDHVRDAMGRALRQTVGPAIGAAIVGYFAYHAVQGDRGLIALSHLQNEIQQAQATLAQVKDERVELEKRASLLRRDHLDPDMLDERARAVLNYSHPDDVIILVPRSSVAPPVTAGKP